MCGTICVVLHVVLCCDANAQSRLGADRVGVARGAARSCRDAGQTNALALGRQRLADRQEERRVTKEAVLAAKRQTTITPEILVEFLGEREVCQPLRLVSSVQHVVHHVATLRSEGANVDFTWASADAEVATRRASIELRQGPPSVLGRVDPEREERLVECSVGSGSEFRQASVPPFRGARHLRRSVAATPDKTTARFGGPPGARPQTEDTSVLIGPTGCEP